MRRWTSYNSCHPDKRFAGTGEAKIDPWTSRGGGIVIKDMIARDHTANVYEKILPEIVASARHKGCATALGHPSGQPPLSMP